MKLVTSAEMRELDAATIRDFGIPGETLMETAGRGVAAATVALAAQAGLRDPSVLLFAGRGNNGGDAFVAARCLCERGLRASVWLAGCADAVGGDSLTHLERMRAAGAELREMPEADDWTAAPGELPLADILVDGLLGTGTRGPARGVIVAAIRLINAMAERRPVVAIDVPSGLDADSGEAPGETVVADLTVTMGLPKRGLAMPSAREYVGRVEVVDIGVPETLTAPLASDEELVVAADVRAWLPRRRRDTHKGTYGRAVIVGGAAGYTGAAGMAARAAARAGAGLVTVVTPRSSVAAVAAAAGPEAMVHGVDETSSGSIAAASWDAIQPLLASAEAVLIGPGMTTHEDTGELVAAALRQGRSPTVVDADALNVLAGRLDDVAAAAPPVVLTPHPGEMARLLGGDSAAIQADRFAAARRAAATARAVVVLKGAGTLVAAPDQPLRVSAVGNPGLATGGTGDVLAGLLAGLLAQGLGPFDAATAAVYIHGSAGDAAAWRMSQTALIASDVLDALPSAWRELTFR